ncbi:hypothetical protein [Spirochaeta cellobiosiphila]|uniref:hypothetical protein n=1 Tax=Spirochaeta cellobiosiphila TaxID=504483 RepID=UPI0012EBF3B0|nr:hypothetical protein [Spirochaeta cellobiosiphila]
MEIAQNPVESASIAMKQILDSAQTQSSDLSNKLLKVNVQQQIDVSQLAYMGNTIDLYA